MPAFLESLNVSGLVVFGTVSSLLAKISECAASPTCRLRPLLPFPPRRFRRQRCTTCDVSAGQRLACQTRPDAAHHHK